MERFTIRLDKDLKKILSEEAKTKGLNLTSYIRMILVERNKK